MFPFAAVDFPKNRFDEGLEAGHASSLIVLRRQSLQIAESRAVRADVMFDAS